MVVFATFAQIPVAARPMNQATASTPPLILLAVIILDDMNTIGGLKRISRLTAVLLALAGFIFPYGSFNGWLERYSRQFGESGARTSIAVEARLGRTMPDRRQASELAEAVPLLARLCRPDQRIYCAAPHNMHMCFLADRAGLPPFPNAAMAATRRDHALILTALERLKPPVAMLEPYDIDVPYILKHAQEWVYIQRHYRLVRKIGNFMILKRKS
jgi:hypothetical protein